MVLKKSNSPFNSGATQKCFHRRVYRRTNEPSELSLNIRLENLPSRYDEKNPSVEHAKALDKIYDYLGFTGPSLKQFHEAAHCYWDEYSRYLNISLNNQELWLLADGIDALMKEDNFLEGQEGYAEISVLKVKRVADRRQIHNKETRILNPPHKKKKKSRNGNKKLRIAGNKRGMQRHHLLNLSDEDSDDDDSHYQRYHRKRVIVELEEEEQMDARVLGRRQDSTEEDWNKMKLSSKAKGCLNGKKAYLVRPYSPYELRKEAKNFLDCDNAWLGDDFNFYDEDNDDIEMAEDCEDSYYYSDRNQQPVCDFPIVKRDIFWPRKKHNRVKFESSVGTNDDEHLVNINTASSKTTLKHAKGSFQIIEKPQDASLTGDSFTLCEDDFVIVEKEQAQLIDSDNAQNEIATVDITEFPIAFTTFDTSDGFVSVNLQFPKDIQDMMLDSLLYSHRYSISIDEYLLDLGNCFPPTFSVALGQTDQALGNGWSLIASAHSDMANHRDLKWEVTIKNTKQYNNNDDYAKDRFFSKLSTMDNEVVQFHYLVQIASESVQLVAIKAANDKTVLTPKMKDVLISNYDSTPNRLAICSVEEAIKRLHVIHGDEPENIESEPVTRMNSCVQVPEEAVECDICLNGCNQHGLNDSGIITLLPCGHSFCNECWRSHIFHHSKAGSTNIRCMHTDCKQVMNESVLKAIMPESSFAKLLSQRQERVIDKSRLCQWCPKSKCDRISLIDESTEHVQQFGCRVVCDCGNTYCFSCQANTHWPMSCSQAAAYRNLLHKIDGDIPVDAICDVELKPCPGCRYPIEKNEGCPHMTCRMCEMEFCWKCLASLHDRHHNVWNCNFDDSSKLVTYHLQNDVINSFPLKFFSQALQIKKKYKSVNKDSVYGWLNGLKITDSRKIKLSFERSVQLTDISLVKSRVTDLAVESVSFLVDSFSFLEYFYVLVSFALLNKDKSSTGSLFSKSTQLTIDKLVHIASRLQDLVVGKSFNYLLDCENTGQMYLAKGRGLLDKLKDRVSSIQKSSKDVMAEPIGELDPTPFFRYV